MKATLTYFLEDPTDRQRWKRAVLADKVFSVLWDILEDELRCLIKYHNEIPGIKREAYDEVRRMIYLKLSDEGVNLNELWT